MGFSTINNLLSGAVKRANIGRQLTASFIVATANEKLKQVLPIDGKDDAKAEMFARGKLTIGGKSGIVCEYLKEHETALFALIDEKLGQGVVQQISYRVIKDRQL